MIRIKVCLPILLTLILSACSADPLRTNQSSNQNIPVDFLFENEGCKVYRFIDS